MWNVHSCGIVASNCKASPIITKQWFHDSRAIYIYMYIYILFFSQIEKSNCKEDSWVDLSEYATLLLNEGDYLSFEDI